MLQLWSICSIYIEVFLTFAIVINGHIIWQLSFSQFNPFNVESWPNGQWWESHINSICVQKNIFGLQHLRFSFKESVLKYHCTTVVTIAGYYGRSVQIAWVKVWPAENNPSGNTVKLYVYEFVKAVFFLKCKL